MKYRYWIKDEFDDLYEFESAWQNDEVDSFDLIAKDAAKDYWQELSDNCNYWEQNESFVFHIFREDGYFLGLFNVECEYKPIFPTTELKCCRPTSEEEKTS